MATMGGLLEPSVLTYARHFNLTRNHIIDDSLTFLNEKTTQFKNLFDDPTDASEGVANLLKLFEETAKNYVSSAEEDPSPVSEDATNLLDTSTNHRIGDIHQVYDALLPDPYRIRKLKLELPVFVGGRGDAEKDVKRVRKYTKVEFLIKSFLEDEEQMAKEQDCPQDEPFVTEKDDAEFLEWWQAHLKARLGKEKLVITKSTVKYLEDVLSKFEDSLDIPKIMQGLFPHKKHAKCLTIDMCNADQDDFCIGGEAETKEYTITSTCGDPEFGRPSEFTSEAEKVDAITEDPFMESTQADRDIEELFRQFTHYDSDILHTVTETPETKGHNEEEPVTKKRKLTHQSYAESVVDVGKETNIESPTAAVERWILQVPEMPSSHIFKLPPTDVAFMNTQENEPGFLDSVLCDPGDLPMRIPTIQEAMRESMPVENKLPDKYLMSEKPVISSGMLLWKEPGLRVLDPGDEEGDTLVAEDYYVGKLSHQSPPSEELFKAQALIPYNPFRRQDSVVKSSGCCEAPEEESELVLTQYKRLTASPVDVKQEPDPKDNFDERKGAPLHIQPLAEIDARTVLQVIPDVSLLQNHVCEPKSRSVSSSAIRPSSSKLTGGAKTSNMGVKRELTDFRSLLPDSKRWHSLQQIPQSKNTSNDSLMTFLDLRGKQFKQPMARQNQQAAELVGDPIKLTQDSPREWHSDDRTLTSSPSQPVEITEQNAVMPAIEPLHDSRTIVVNNILLQTKPLLIQFLEKPENSNLTLVYRDLDTRQCHGPDLVLNTTTCLLITSLQSLNQRPLPGQHSATGLSSAHDQIAYLARSYSQIVVLIHHTETLDCVARAKTSLAQVSFSAFCQSFSRPFTRKQIQPYWLSCADPASTAEVVNAWVWQVICGQAYRSRNVKSEAFEASVSPTLIREETLWELFLCKAGLNPLAAQVVLGSLRKPNRPASRSSGREPTWGLRRLVAMSPQERTDIFGRLIGISVVENLNVVFAESDVDSIEREM